MAQRTALTTLRNSTPIPSAVRFTARLLNGSSQSNQTAYSCVTLNTMRGVTMANADRLLNEAREVIASGNKIVSVFLVGAVVWWSGNLLPYDFGGGTPTAKLAKLQKLTKDSGQECRTLQNKYFSSYFSSVENSCPLPPLLLPGTFGGEAKGQTSLANMSDPFWEAFRKAGPEVSASAIRVGIETASEAVGCDHGKINELRMALARCESSLATVTKFNDEMSNESGLDIAGVKIANIHTRWHAAFLLLILALGATWLGVTRHRAFHILDQHMKARLPVPTTEPVLLTLPWWLLPGPSWPNRGTSSFRAELASQSEYARARIVLCFIAVLLAILVASAIEAQKLLTVFSMSNLRLTWMVDQVRSFSLTGSLPIDLAMFTGIFFLSVGFFWWIAPPRQTPASRQLAVRLNRRELIRTGTAFGAALFSTVAIPFFVARKSTVALAKKASWDLGLPMSARYRRRKRKYARYQGPSGWYRSSKAEVDPDEAWVAHFVKPGYRFEHAAGRGRPLRPRARKRRRIKSIMRWATLFRPTIPNKKRRTRLVAYPSGRIRASWRMKVAQLTRLSEDALPAFQPPKKQRLNVRFYSEGVETLSLQHWQSGDRERALELLRIGLTYAKNGRPLNIRLYDLLAGLLVRSGRLAELALLHTELAGEVAQLQANIGTLTKQLEAKISGSAVGLVRSPRTQLLPTASVADRPTIKTTWSESNAEIAQLKDRLRQSTARLKHTQSRRDNWLRPDGRWAKKWIAGTPQRWGGVDILS
jgi:hypothetical protein